MADYWIWWILAAILVGAELMTGTFYLLAVGVAFAVGGLAAVLGVALPLQLVVAGVVARGRNHGRASVAAEATSCRRSRRSTSGRACECWAGRTTAARA